MTTRKLLLAITTLAAALLPLEAYATQAAAAPATTKDTKKDATKKSSTKAAANTAPTPAQISDAQAKGMVWANKNTKVYHKSGDFYGKTKSGEFMTEADAQKAGYKAAQEPGSKKKSAPKADAKTAPKK